MVDNEVNLALARLYACEFKRATPRVRTLANAIREGDYEVVRPDGLRFGNGVIRTKWTGNLVKARDSFFSSSSFSRDCY